jgi:uncharacterized membrane protein HdeD (DUF308 family)
MNPVRSYTIILGVALLAAGLVGFSRGKLLGSNIAFFYNMTHFISGVLGVAAATHLKAWARIYDKIIGIFYGAIGLLGLLTRFFFGGASGNSVNILHIAIAITALAYGYDGEASTVQIRSRRAATKSEFEQRAEELKKKAEEEERRRRAA